MEDTRSKFLFGKIVTRPVELFLLVIVFTFPTAVMLNLFLSIPDHNTLILSLGFFIGLIVLSGLLLGPFGGLLVGALGSIWTISIAPPAILILVLVFAAGGLVPGLLAHMLTQSRTILDLVGAIIGVMIILLPILFTIGSFAGTWSIMPEIFIILAVPIGLVEGIVLGLLTREFQKVLSWLLDAVAPKPSITVAKTPEKDADEEIQVLRGGEFVGNRLRYKVKVLNKSDSVITDVTVTVSSYPRDSLVLETEITKTISKLEPKGFRSPTFEFLPTQDCVQGDVISIVSYVDSSGKAHSVTSEPFIIRAVCDLLTPETISMEEFSLRLEELDCGETSIKVEDWTSAEMKSKTLQILEESNFFEVSSISEDIADHQVTHITGWAKGKYTGKNLGVKISISGIEGEKGTTAKIEMRGEDEAMIMPALDEFSKKLAAWLCPMCGGMIPKDLVDDLKAGRSVQCGFCGATIDR